MVALAVVVAGYACGKTEPDENRPPEAVGEFPSLTVTEGESWSGSIEPFFRDPDGDTLTYTAESSKTSVLTVAMAGAQLTITAVDEGESKVTLTATDPEGLSAEMTGNVTVEPPNRPPVVGAQIPDLTLQKGASVDIPVDLVFSDPDGDVLTITAESDAEGVATVSVDEYTVTVTAIEVGTANITVTATDPGGLSVSDTFEVTVEESD